AGCLHFLAVTKRDAAYGNRSGAERAAGVVADRPDGDRFVGRSRALVKDGCLTVQNTCTSVQILPGPMSYATSVRQRRRVDRRPGSPPAEFTSWPSTSPTGTFPAPPFSTPSRRARGTGSTSSACR